ncbi:MAG: ThuA domain-containing protein [Phycisphaerales bacterium]|nr:ThuA domain-containing protein [Phycisphaerales bacterium]
MSPLQKKIKVAVIVGEHDYDVPNFQKAFESLDGVECYYQNLLEFISSAKVTRNWYDVLVFYNYHLPTPPSGGDTKAVLDALGETGQHILILHHAVLAYPEWSKWSDICGMADRSFKYHDGMNVDFKIVKNHPITEGVQDFSMVDETYEMKSAEGDDGNDVLITTDHPRSAKTILWTRTHKKSKVVCYSSGHDASAFADPNFRKLVENSIKWLMS